VTRGAGPALAGTAHAAWRLVLAYPVVWLALALAATPAVSLEPRGGVWPAAIVQPSAPVRDAAIALYVVVAAVLLGRLIAGLVAVSRLTAASRPLSPADLQRLRACAGPLPDIAFRETALRVPVTAGILRRVVLLPEGWRDLRDVGLGAIVHHELAHVRRADFAWGVLASAVEALFWFHPAAWVAGSRLRWFAELASDAEAARAMGGARYGSELLALAAAWSGAPRPRIGVTVGAASRIAQRIALVLEGPRRGSAAALACAILMLLVVMGAAAGVRVGFREQAGLTDIFDASHVSTHQTRHRSSHRASHAGP
jgi:D-alanyl-D-alanine endopeptidase (penicillin-binding protein 7)